MLLWMRNSDIIAVNDRVIEKDPRFKLEKAPNGNTLVISLAEEADAGNYTCQISTYRPSNLHHNVRIRGELEEKKESNCHPCAAASGNKVLSYVSD